MSYMNHLNKFLKNELKISKSRLFFISPEGANVTAEAWSFFLLLLSCYSFYIIYPWSRGELTEALSEVDKRLTMFKIQCFSVLISSITLKVEDFCLYSPTQETLEYSRSHYYDSVTKLQLINYRFTEPSSSTMFQF